MPDNRLMDSSDREGISEIILVSDPRQMRDEFVKQHFNVPGTVREVMNQNDVCEHQHARSEQSLNLS